MLMQIYATFGRIAIKVVVNALLLLHYDNKSVGTLDLVTLQL